MTLEEWIARTMAVLEKMETAREAQIGEIGADSEEAQCIARGIQHMEKALLELQRISREDD